MDRFLERGVEDEDVTWATGSRRRDGTHEGGSGLSRGIHDLHLMANACDIAWTMIGQAAQGAGDPELLEVVNSYEGQTATQIKWLKTRMKQTAP
jgi:hypothetical protein